MPSRPDPQPGSAARLSLAALPALALAGAAGLAGCDAGPCKTSACRDQAAVAAVISLAPEEPSGVTRGFDLDGRVNQRGDPESCGHPDFLSPDGEEGIDNQSAILWSVILGFAGDAVDGLLRDAVHDGKLLVMLALEGVDDWRDDDCVDVSLFLGEGAPLLGTNGRMLPDQTFAPAEDGRPGRARCAVVEDGVLTTGRFDLTLPVRILDVDFELRIEDALLEARLSEDGPTEVMLGGGVPIADLIAAVESGVRDEEPRLLVTHLLRTLADLGRDEYGDCQMLSTTILFDMTPAFVY